MPGRGSGGIGLLSYREGWVHLSLLSYPPVSPPTTARSKPAYISFHTGAMLSTDKRISVHFKVKK